VSVCQLRPESRGEIRLASTDPLAKPNIHARYLTSETDKQCMVEGVKLAKRLADTKALGHFIADRYSPPEGAPENDAAWLDFVRKTSGTIYHPTGTCRMGEDAAAVVDTQLRVNGVGNLRVADGSIMPTVVSGNTNAGCIMIGERCADFMKRAA
jgi:choline dehydrogenase